MRMPRGKNWFQSGEKKSQFIRYIFASGRCSNLVFSFAQVTRTYKSRPSQALYKWLAQRNWKRSTQLNSATLLPKNPTWHLHFNRNVTRVSVRLIIRPTVHRIVSHFSTDTTLRLITCLDSSEISAACTKCAFHFHECSLSVNAHKSRERRLNIERNGHCLYQTFLN